MFDSFTALSAILLLSLSISVYLFFQLKRRNQSLQQMSLELQQQHDESVRQSAVIEQFSEVESKNIELSMQLTELQPLKGSLEQLERQLTDLKAQLTQKEQSYAEQNQLLQLSESKCAELNKALELEKSSAEEKLALLDTAKQQLANEFKVLSNQIFETKQAQFTQNAQTSLDGLLKPMRASLDEFKSRVELVHKEDLEGRAGLTEQLKQLYALNHKMSEEANNLTQALKGDSKTQGNWGELILERLLERSGLREGVEFDRERSFTDEHGKRLRPDVVINLPDHKHIVIDSKVSLVHYEQALNSDDELVRTAALKSHLQSLKTHIDTLANKRYEHLELLNAPDFVLMFIPVEGAYLMAIEADSSVFENAFEKRVAVVTPTTLFTTLKTIEQLWRYERQSENTLKLIKRAAEVHDKFVGFVESFEKVGKQIQTVQGTYESARNQMIQGKGNLVRQAEMLKELAGKTKKEIPKHLLDEAEGARELINESD